MSMTDAKMKIGIKIIQAELTANTGRAWGAITARFPNATSEQKLLMMRRAMLGLLQAK